jgi:hypothetical protein
MTGIGRAALLTRRGQWVIGRLDVPTRFALLGLVVVLFSVSGGLLWDLGYNYDGLTGSAAAKIHPFTYGVVILLLWRSLSCGSPLAYGAFVVSARPAATALLFAAFLLLLMTALKQGPGLAGLFDTYIGTVALVYLLVECDDETRFHLALVLHALMAANALLAIYEFASHTLVFPYRFEGIPFEMDKRPSALQGHPLVNASLTAIYLMALLAGGRSLPRLLRIGIIVLQCAALVVFGGRSALVAAALFGPACLIGQAFAALRRNRVSLVATAAAVITLSLAPPVVVTVVGSGALDSVLLRFSYDGGSANARFAMLDLFQGFSWTELLVGPDLSQVEALRWKNGLEMGIENPIVRMTLYQGGFLTLLIFGALALFAMELSRQKDRGTVWPILVAAVLINTSEAIAVKTTILAKIVVVIVCLFNSRRQPGGGVRPSDWTIAGSRARVASSISPMLSNRHQNAQGKR